MRRTLLTILLAVVAIACQAQDSLYFHNGNTAVGEVKEVEDSHITFMYENETALHVIGTNALEYIRFASGRVQQMSEKIVIEGEKDWQKVRIVYDKNEVRGLSSIGQISKKSSGAWSFHVTAGHFSEKVATKLRKAAAKRGSCIVLVLSQTSNSAGFFKSGSASVSAEMYKY